MFAFFPTFVCICLSIYFYVVYLEYLINVNIYMKLISDFWNALAEYICYFFYEDQAPSKSMI